MRKEMMPQVPLRVIPPIEWAQTPIQPSAGAWWKILRRISISFLVVVGCFVLSVFTTPSGKDTPWFVWGLCALAIVQAVVGIVVAIKANGPYKAERRLGYTTWPAP